MLKLHFVRLRVLNYWLSFQKIVDWKPCPLLTYYYVIHSHELHLESLQIKKAPNSTEPVPIENFRIEKRYLVFEA